MASRPLNQSQDVRQQQQRQSRVLPDVPQKPSHQRRDEDIQPKTTGRPYSAAAAAANQRNNRGQQQYSAAGAAPKSADSLSKGVAAAASVADRPPRNGRRNKNRNNKNNSSNNSNNNNNGDRRNAGSDEPGGRREQRADQRNPQTMDEGRRGYSNDVEPRGGGAPHNRGRNFNTAERQTSEPPPRHADPPRNRFAQQREQNRAAGEAFYDQIMKPYEESAERAMDAWKNAKIDWDDDLDDWPSFAPGERITCDEQQLLATCQTDEEMELLCCAGQLRCIRDWRAQIVDRGRPRRFDQPQQPGRPDQARRVSASSADESPRNTTSAAAAAACTIPATVAPQASSMVSTRAVSEQRTATARPPQPPPRQDQVDSSSSQSRAIAAAPVPPPRVGSGRRWETAPATDIAKPVDAAAKPDDGGTDNDLSEFNDDTRQMIAAGNLTIEEARESLRLEIEKDRLATKALVDREHPREQQQRPPALPPKPTTYSAAAEAADSSSWEQARSKGHRRAKPVAPAVTNDASTTTTTTAAARQYK